MLLWGFEVKTRHTVDAYLGALTPLSVGAGFKPAPTIYLSEEEKNEADKFLDRNGISKGITLIGLAPGAKWPTKKWMEEGFIEVGRKAVKEFGAGVLIFGGPDEADLSKRVAEGIGNKALSVAGVAGLKETAALISRCKAFVSNDSGPMHMATAVGTPVIAIFGPTVKGFGFFPLGRSTVVEKELRCRPCSLHGSKTCPKGHFECMKGITANEVFDKVEGVIQRRPGLVS